MQIRFALCVFQYAPLKVCKTGNSQKIGHFGDKISAKQRLKKLWLLARLKLMTLWQLGQRKWRLMTQVTISELWKCCKLRPCYTHRSRQLRPCYNHQSHQLRPPCYNHRSRQLRPGDDRLSSVKEVTDNLDDPTDDKWWPKYVRRDWSDDSRRDFFAKKKIFLASCLSCGFTYYRGGEGKGPKIECSFAWFYLTTHLSHCDSHVAFEVSYTYPRIEGMTESLHAEKRGQAAHIMLRDFCDNCIQ